MEIKKFTPLRQPLTPEQQDQKLKDVSKLYEKQFLREMMKQMRSTVTEGGFMPANNAEKIFREQLDQEYVEKWGDHGGIGLADMIHKQLLERLGPALGITPHPLKPQGPIKIDPKSAVSNPLKLTSQSAKKISMEMDLRAVALESPDVTAPWSGSLLGTQRLDSESYAMEILHDHGLKSQLVFRGQPEAGLGPEISAGQRIGLLSPEAKSLFWTVSL